MPLGFCLARAKTTLHEGYSACVMVNSIWFCSGCLDAVLFDSFLNYPPSLARLIHTFMLIALVPLGLAAGAIAHFWGYQRLIKFGVVTTIILTYPLWIGLQSVTFGRALATLLLLAVVL